MGKNGRGPLGDYGDRVTYTMPKTLEERRALRRRLEDALDLVRSDRDARRTLRRVIDALDARGHRPLP